MCSRMENVILNHWGKITLTVGEFSPFEEQCLMWDSLVMKFLAWEINQVQI